MNLYDLVSTTTRRARVLSADANVPPVAQTAVGADLLEAFQIVAQLGGNVLRKDLAVLSRLEIFLTVQEPKRDLELPRVLNDGHQLFDFVRRQFAGAGVDVDFGLLADQIRKSAADTGNFSQSKDHIALSFDVRIQDTQNVLKFWALNQRGRPVC